MPLVDIAQQTPGTPDKGPTCGACHLTATLPPEESAAFRQMLGDPRWRYSALEEVLRGEGYLIGAAALARHARGQCAGREKLR